MTKAEPKMWGSSIVGFGAYHYKYASGHEGDWPLVGFSPRKQNLTVYVVPGFENYDAIHLPTLRALIKRSVAEMKKKYKTE